MLKQIAYDFLKDENELPEERALFLSLQTVYSFWHFLLILLTISIICISNCRARTNCFLT